MSEAGYTLSYRSKWMNPVFKNLLEAGIWAWMCDTAVWKDTRIRFNGQLIELKRGQLATSVRFISSGFQIGERVTRRFLQNLEKDGMIDTRATHWGTIITICNYNKYQLNEKAGDTPTDTRPTHDRHTTDTNKNKGNKGNEVNKDYTAAFLEFWKEYPKRKGSNPKEDAKKKFLKICEKTDPQEIIAGAKKYAVQEKRNGNLKTPYIAQAITWLNQTRWKDEYDTGQKERQNYIGM